MGQTLDAQNGYQNDVHADEQNSMLLKGMVIGGLIGGALALIDYNTRTKVKNTAAGLKDTSTKLITEVKENPGEVKDQMISQFKAATNTLKEAINDAQELYQRVNKDVFGNINTLKEISSEAFSTAREAKSEIRSIKSKVKEAGTELVDNSIDSNSSPDRSDSYASHSTNFAYPKR
jgi:gas vesicle protein